MPSTLKPDVPSVEQANDCRQHGISSATSYIYGRFPGNKKVSDAKRLKALEDESHRP